MDGIQNVIQMLEGIEDGRLPEADFLELSACTQGCVGGCFNVENPYAAKLRLKGLMKGLPVSRNRFRLPEAVSYTHLDVYKRQAQDTALGGGLRQRAGDRSIPGRLKALLPEVGMVAALLPVAGAVEADPMVFLHQHLISGGQREPIVHGQPS